VKVAGMTLCFDFLLPQKQNARALARAFFVPL
jgi:hypothetical protein